MTEALNEMTEALDELRTATERLDTVDGLEERLNKLENIEARRELLQRQAKRPRGDGSVAGADEGYGADVLLETRDKFRQALAGEIEMRDMSIGSNPDGGYMVPLEIDRTINNQLIDISPVRSVASVVTTGTSNYRKLVNVRGSNSGWAAETSTRTATNSPRVEAIEPPHGELFANPSVTNWALMDSQFVLETFLSENVTTEFAFQEGSAFISGNGIDKPRGFLNYSTATTDDDTRSFGTLQEMQVASPTAVTGDELIDMLYKLRPSYRQGDGVGWMMNSTTASIIRKLKDGDGNYLWQPPFQAGQPASLLGYRVIEAEDMPDMAADQYPIAFGNWRRGYLVVDRTQTQIIRDNVTTPGFTKFYFARRVGGAVTDSNALKLLKMAAS